MNLFLASLWLLVAAVCFFWTSLNPGAREPTILDTGINLGWVALALFVYNMVRWWANRPAVPVPPAEQPRAPRVEHPPDPNFNFSDKPAPPRSKPPETPR